MLEGIGLLTSLRELEGKNGKFKIARIGDPVKCSSYSVFVPNDLILPTGLVEGVKVRVSIGLEEVDYKLRASLLTLKLA